jgi:thiosulfate dehydrogenase [quinone] large subunit
MDFPFIDSKVNFLVDYHLVYAGVLGLLMVKQAGHVWGLDGIASRMSFFKEHPSLGVLV